MKKGKIEEKKVLNFLDFWILNFLLSISIHSTKMKEKRQNRTSIVMKTTIPGADLRKIKEREEEKKEEKNRWKKKKKNKIK